MIKRHVLEKFYKQGLSMSDIADRQSCSCSQVAYWMEKYQIPRRTWSEATYVKRNPKGDPFRIKSNFTPQEMFLEGLGLGLYWGEGTKRSRDAVRLGNTDPRLIKKFIEFLESIYSIDRSRLRFGLQIFTDVSSESALKFWQKELGFPEAQFFKVVVTSARGKGTYREKSKYGVLTVYFGNKKLRDIIYQKIEKLQGLVYDSASSPM